MRPEPSVHDNIVYAYTVDCEARRLVLHTVFRHREPNEFTDVVFREVVAHDFSHVLAGNILFDVGESDIATLILQNKELFAESWRYGWPPVDYNGDLNVLLKALRAASVRGIPSARRLAYRAGFLQAVANVYHAASVRRSHNKSLDRRHGKRLSHQA